MVPDHQLTEENPQTFWRRDRIISMGISTHNHVLIDFQLLQKILIEFFLFQVVQDH